MISQGFDAFELWKTLESPLDSKKMKPVNPKGNQSWIFIGRTDAETPILSQPESKSQLTRKDPMLGKIEGGRRGWQETRWLDGITEWMDMSLSKLKMVKDREVWRAAVRGVVNSRRQLSDWTTTKFYILEKGMVTHSSILAWRIPWTEEPGGIQSMGWQRDTIEWLTQGFICIFCYMPWESCPKKKFHLTRTTPWYLILFEFHNILRRKEKLFWFFPFA